jgi:hypothetical protein
VVQYGMITHDEHIKLQFNKAATMLKVNGILSIVFGVLGSIVMVVVIALFAMPALYEPDYTFMQAVITEIGLFIFAFLPHVFFIVSGSLLLSKPRPGLARGLVIANVALSASLNVVLLAFAIVSLTQTSDYERGYDMHSPRKRKV